MSRSAKALQIHDKHFIGGEWVHPATTRMIDVISPHSEELIARVPDGDVGDIDRAVAVARAAFDRGDWSEAPPHERIAAMERFSQLYTHRLMQMADVISAEMGAPILFSQLAQATAPLMMLEAFIGAAKCRDWEEERAGMLGAPVVVRSEGVGVVGAIVPWNTPQFVIMAKLAPALLAGCSVIVKPAPETPLDALLMASMLEEVGIPRGVISVVPGGRSAGERLVRHTDVDKIAFTGSTGAGRAIAAACGDQLKRVSLELGGKSAAIVLEDVELESVLGQLKFASLLNGGQACVAQSRILAPRSRYDEVVDALATTVDGMAVGDPSDPETEIGPMATEAHQTRVLDYIATGIREGARVVAGGLGRPAGAKRGWYVQPTVFADVDNDMRVAREEIFGPVLTVIAYDDVDDAVRIANDSDFGLAGSVWTGDPAGAGMDVARRIRTGTFGINHYSMDFGAPFGGFKSSGIGREFGPEGLAEYVELKSIVLAQDT